MPRNLEADALDGAVFLSWDPPASDGGWPVTSYDVIVRTGGAWFRTMFTTATSLTVSDLTNGVTYTFRVYATNADGDSATYAQVSTTPQPPPAPPGPPGAPRDVQATPGNGSATVSWRLPADDGGAPVTSFELEAYQYGSWFGRWTVSATSVTVDGLRNGWQYQFRMAATNAYGTGPWTDLSPAVWPGTPGPVRSLAATPGDRQVTLTWGSPSYDNGWPVGGYDITVYRDDVWIRSEWVTATSATINPLVNGITYTFFVTPYNDNGSGPEDDVSAVPRTMPGAPTGVTARSGDGRVTVSWTPPADNGGAGITSYSVTVRSLAGVETTVTAAASPVTVTGLDNGVNYSFTVAARNEAGTGPESDPPVRATPRSEDVVPVAPTGVSGVAGDGEVLLSWSAPADDGGAAVILYSVTAYSGTIAVLTVSSTTTSATVSGLENGVAYTFTVAATNAVGVGSASAPSPPLTPAAPVTPPAEPLPPPQIPAPVRYGYWMVSAEGTVYSFGDATTYGNALVGSATAVDLEPTATGNGYWILDHRGKVYAFGDAVHLGNVPAFTLVQGERATSLSATREGTGYWIFTTRGRVLTFGNAPFLGDVSGVALNGPVSDSISTPTGLGYYMVASDGGIFAFGDARFHGSMGGQRLNAAVQSLVPDADGIGYWLVASDGGVFAFQAGFMGSMGGVPLNKPITGMVRAGHGYLMVAEDGGIFDFSGAPDGFKGSLGGNPPASPITSIALLEIR